MQKITSNWIILLFGRTLQIVACVHLICFLARLMFAKCKRNKLEGKQKWFCCIPTLIRIEKLSVHRIQCVKWFCRSLSLVSTALNMKIAPKYQTNLHLYLHILSKFLLTRYRSTKSPFIYK